MKIAVDFDMFQELVVDGMDLYVENAALKRALKSMFAKYENADAERDEAHTKQGDLERKLAELDCCPYCDRDLSDL